MRIDKNKLEAEMAKTGTRNRDISARLDMSMAWVGVMLQRARNGANMTPATVGQIAAAIGCPPENIIADEAGR